MSNKVRKNSHHVPGGSWEGHARNTSTRGKDIVTLCGITRGEYFSKSADESFIVDDTDDTSARVGCVTCVLLYFADEANHAEQEDQVEP